MGLFKKVNLYKVNNIAEEIEIESLLGSEKEKTFLKKAELDRFTEVGDILLLVKNNRAGNLEKRKVISYPVKKIKGRFSDVKEYIYLKMKILYDFNFHYLGKKEIEAVEKDADHIKFEKLMDQKQAEIEKLITYNADERVEPFNHTNYEVASILNSKKIFRQEIGEKFDWGWTLMEIYQLDQNNFVSYKQSSYFRERQRGEFFDISKKAVEFMRTFEDDKDDFLD
ncbi:hypothetical protein C8C77_12613 [Halanaerobium saccharolyticum]|uniref:Uncharacterized protein n=1 Tax=Halanaerobium saccharolyticum TaxID=43595 RepID=A0A4R7YUC1_9FIRM|nr:hypothetical protein [Halanaerobium saccharolyticum]RAK06334.1 hypothetical protein C7958_12313 [Halanaerobium saccharolyticum]TDW00646.1 hypothetical protein C8C77_12613 [Halanaerobium saccharolyticum]TDX52259.1 hypothetical protein C7956_12513 [Halanaerobium saccharolyticum]